MTDNDYIKQVCAEKHKNIDCKIAEHSDCLETLKTMLNDIQKQTAILQAMFTSLKNKQDLQDKQIDELRQKPAKQWDRITASVLDFVILGVLGYILAFGK